MNLDAFIARLGAMGEELKRQRTVLITKVVLIGEGEVKKETPVLTGTLRRTINGQVVSDKEGRIGTALHYAPHVYFGTIYIDPNPYLDRGLANMKVAAEPLLREAGAQIIGKVAGQ